MTTPVLAPYFFQQFLNQTGTAPAVGGKLFFYIAGTSTKQAIYADSVGTPLSNPVILDSTGSVPYLWMDPTLIYKVVLAPPNDTDPPVSAYRSEDNIQPPVNGSTIALVLTGAILGSILFPITAAETATGFTTGTLSMQYPYGNVLRYGIVPNNAGANTTNATKFAALVNASIADGPTGWIYFPNSGSVATPDNYYFGANAPFQVRDWCDIDLGGCTLTFQDSFNAAQTDMGFFVMCRNARLRNGNIVVNYNGTAGTNNGPAIRFGSRSGYPWGIYTTGIFDQDNLLANGLPLQGNLKFENLRISSNNPSVMIVYGLGGLRNVSFENVWIDGQNVQTVYGFYYEFGWSSTNGQPGTQAAWTSSHMTNLSIKNMSITNMAVGGNSYAFGMRGSYNCSIDGLYINTADNAFDLSSGEAFYYRVWAQDVTTPDRNHELRNIVVKNTTSLGALLGAAAVSGYLAATINALAAPAKYQAQTDFLNYLIDGFNAEGCAGGLQISGGTVSIRNGTFVGNGGSSSGGLIIGAETMHLTLENVQVLNFAGTGVRCGFAPTIWSPARPGWVSVRNSKICGNTTGIVLSACQAAIIENNQIGYNTLYDVAAEGTQTGGINLAATSFGVVCRNNYVSTFGGTSGYISANTTAAAGNYMSGERNAPPTFAGAGSFITDVTPASAQAITTGGTVTISNQSVSRLNPAAAVTGLIMPAGNQPGQIQVVINEAIAANTATFAVVGTSRVADGVACIIAGLTQKTFVWDTGTSTWFHS